MTYIRHITLATGHTSSVELGDVSGETVARVRPWLAALVASGQPAPLPVSGLASYSGQATVIAGGLVVTISGAAASSGPLAGQAPPLVTLGVAARSRHSAGLWAVLTAAPMPPARPGLRFPDAPWVAAAIWPTIALHMAALEWVGDLERCIAWAWCTRQPADGPAA